MLAFLIGEVVRDEALQRGIQNDVQLFFLRKMNDYYTLESIVCTFVDGAGSSIGAVVVVVVLRPFEGMYRAPGIYRHSI
jgi:hypothetical protein